MVDLQNPYETDESAVRITVWLIVAIGALNWGLMAALDVNLVTDLLGSGGANLAYLAVGAAGAVNLLELVGVDVFGGEKA